MSSLTEGQVLTLQELKNALGGTRFALVGATALACHIGLYWRMTSDLDIAIAVELDALPSTLRALAGWSPDPKREQAWLSGSGVRVDFIPAGPMLLRSGEIVWPETGARMSLLGFEHALNLATAIELAPGLKVPVAPVAVIVLLKAVAFSERPGERIRDLSDIAYALESYPPIDDDRRYSEEIQNRMLTHEQSGCFVLGAEIRAFVTPEELDVLNVLVRQIEQEIDGGRTRALMLQNGPRTWNGDPKELMSRIEAFRLGLGDDA